MARLREAHRALAMELTATQRRLYQREQEVRRLRAALSAYRTIRQPLRTTV